MSEVEIPKFHLSKMEPFIAHILFIIIILSSLSTFVDYQFKIEIGNQFSSDLQMMKFFGKFYMIIDSLIKLNPFEINREEKKKIIDKIDEDKNHSIEKNKSFHQITTRNHQKKVCHKRKK